MDVKDRIFPSIDVDTLEQAKVLMEQIKGSASNIKLGLQIATGTSWKECIDAAHDMGFKIFCDAKFKDIPNTVEHAAYALTLLGPDYFTVMADNSFDALLAVRKGTDRAAAERGVEPPKIIGVTVLTSIGPDEVHKIYGGDAKTKVRQFAQTAAKAGLDAIVCSPEEVAELRADPALKDLLLITPGVRPEWAASNDQVRSATPSGAIRNGADMLVIGRPITQPPESIGTPADAIQKIIKEIEEM